MSSVERIDFPPRQFSSVEIKALLMLSAEVSNNIENIGQNLAALSNASYLDQTTDDIVRQMIHEANLARSGIDKITSIISVEQELLNSEG